MSRLLVLIALFMGALPANANKVAITMDDLRSTADGELTAQERTGKILMALSDAKVKAALFVCGMRVDSQEGQDLVRQWDRAGHLIANHSYSHLYYHSSKVTFEEYRDDFLRGESIIKAFTGFTKLYRFPYLKEGNTTEKRDKFRQVLESKGYRNGYVTIDASDWYIDQRMREKLKTNPNFDLASYRKYFFEHIWDRTQFYDGLAKKVVGREITHTLLLHDNTLNALFLHDLIEMFRQKGWEVVDAEKAYEDEVYTRHPSIVPAGESLIWGLAKETGKYDDILRYPGEDEQYEKPKMDKLGL